MTTDSFRQYYWRCIDDALATLIRAGWKSDLVDCRHQLEHRFSTLNNPNGRRFFEALTQSPRLTNPRFSNHDGTVTIVGDNDPVAAVAATAERLIPWRKGPFCVGGVDIDAEWRSDIKWDRLGDVDGWIRHRRVLDIGCNSGYYMFRMLDHDPKIVVGVDPSDLFFFQFNWLYQWVSHRVVSFLPLRIESISGWRHWFDTVFSMGILYHQRSPIDALRHWRELIKPHGRLILETLIIDDPGDFSITPRSAYAKMANVFFLPTLTCLTTWAHRAGFRTIDVIDISRTTAHEQRKTPWVNTETLSDFLDPSNPLNTIEGYPAPTRALLHLRIS